MRLLLWDELPSFMKNDSVRIYYNILEKKRLSMTVKRTFDIFTSIVLIIMLILPFFVLSLMIKADSKGPAFFRQERATQYGKRFLIMKFRTMDIDAEKKGSNLTVNDDKRITKTGQFLRKYHIDEMPQLFNILTGDMSFVGTRPEVLKYVASYTDEMIATLLLPAGITSEASIQYKDESLVLFESNDIDEFYINKILPQKMKYNLQSLSSFSFFSEVKTLFKTLYIIANKRKSSVINEIENSVYEDNN